MGSQLAGAGRGEGKTREKQREAGKMEKMAENTMGNKTKNKTENSQPAGPKHHMMALRSVILCAVRERVLNKLIPHTMSNSI